MPQSSAFDHRQPADAAAGVAVIASAHALHQKRAAAVGGSYVPPAESPLVPPQLSPTTAVSGSPALLNSVSTALSVDSESGSTCSTRQPSAVFYDCRSPGTALLAPPHVSDSAQHEPFSFSLPDASATSPRHNGSVKRASSSIMTSLTERHSEGLLSVIDMAPLTPQDAMARSSGSEQWAAMQRPTSPSRGPLCALSPRHVTLSQGRGSVTQDFNTEGVLSAPGSTLMLAGGSTASLAAGIFTSPTVSSCTETFDTQTGRPTPESMQHASPPARKLTAPKDRPHRQRGGAGTSGAGAAPPGSDTGSIMSPLYTGDSWASGDGSRLSDDGSTDSCHLATPGENPTTAAIDSGSPCDDCQCPDDIQGPKGIKGGADQGAELVPASSESGDFADISSGCTAPRAAALQEGSPAPSTADSATFHHDPTATPQKPSLLKAPKEKSKRLGAPLPVPLHIVSTLKRTANWVKAEEVVFTEQEGTDAVAAAMRQPMLDNAGFPLPMSPTPANVGGGPHVPRRNGDVTMSLYQAEVPYCPTGAWKVTMTIPDVRAETVASIFGTTADHRGVANMNAMRLVDPDLVEAIMLGQTGSLAVQEDQLRFVEPHVGQPPVAGDAPARRTDARVSKAVSFFGASEEPLSPPRHMDPTAPTAPSAAASMGDRSRSVSSQGSVRGANAPTALDSLTHSLLGDSRELTESTLRELMCADTPAAAPHLCREVQQLLLALNVDEHNRLIKMSEQGEALRSQLLTARSSDKLKRDFDREQWVTPRILPLPAVLSPQAPTAHPARTPPPASSGKAMPSLGRPSLARSSTSTQPPGALGTPATVGSDPMGSVFKEEDSLMSRDLSMQLAVDSSQQSSSTASPRLSRQGSTSTAVPSPSPSPGAVHPHFSFGVDGGSLASPPTPGALSGHAAPDSLNSAPPPATIDLMAPAGPAKRLVVLPSEREQRWYCRLKSPFVATQERDIVVRVMPPRRLTRGEQVACGVAPIMKRRAGGRSATPPPRRAISVTRGRNTMPGDDKRGPHRSPSPQLRSLSIEDACGGGRRGRSDRTMDVWAVASVPDGSLPKRASTVRAMLHRSGVIAQDLPLPKKKANAARAASFGLGAPYGLALDDDDEDEDDRTGGCCVTVLWAMDSMGAIPAFVQAQQSRVLDLGKRVVTAARVAQRTVNNGSSAAAERPFRCEDLVMFRRPPGYMPPSVLKKASQ